MQFVLSFVGQQDEFSKSSFHNFQLKTPSNVLKMWERSFPQAFFLDAGFLDVSNTSVTIYLAFRNKKQYSPKKWPVHTALHTF